MYVNLLMNLDEIDFQEFLDEYKKVISIGKKMLVIVIIKDNIAKKSSSKKYLKVIYFFFFYVSQNEYNFINI